MPKPLISYFEMTLHMGITFKVGSSLKVIEITYGLLHNKLTFRYSI